MEGRLGNRPSAVTRCDATAVALTCVQDADFAALAPVDYVLVSNTADWDAVVEAGLDPVTTHVRFSLTDPRSNLPARLGRLIMPWRWRRTILNAGIRELRCTWRAPLAPAVGAVLAGATVRVSRRGG